MSNSTENSITTNRSALTALGNTKPLTRENTADIENEVAKIRMHSAVKNQNETNNSKKKVILKPKEKQETEKAETEEVKTLKNTLKEAMDENDILRERVQELECMLGAIGDELEQRDKAILELANALEAQREAQRQAEISPGQDRRSQRRKSRKHSDS